MTVEELLKTLRDAGLEDDEIKALFEAGLEALKPERSEEEIAKEYLGVEVEE